MKKLRKLLSLLSRLVRLKVYKFVLYYIVHKNIFSYLGYRALDTANDYDNEHIIGEALQELFAQGVVKREDLFIQVRYNLLNSVYVSTYV